ncbi:hypothetical protein VTL71DRAFT_12420 [Oculimacula yallundae]|uniref:SET domain-containing protein n=1 Tax=Oculimacula yallundae TaxID=86028 RepID=A0ABR4CN02_9HELO
MKKSKMSGNYKKSSGAQKGIEKSTMVSPTKPADDAVPTIETKAERNKRNKLKKENAKKVKEAANIDPDTAAESKTERNRRKHHNAKRTKADKKKSAADEKDLLEKAQALSIKERQEERDHVHIRYDVTDTEDDSSATLSDQDTISEPEHREDENETIPETPAGLLFTFKSSPGKGIGAFANNNIKQGTEMLVEEAIMRGSPEWICKEALFKVLSKEKQDRILALHSRCDCESVPCLETPLMKIWDVNSFKADGGAAMLFDIASRFNHDCRPNVSRGFSKEDYIVFRAARDIEKGEELTVNYILRPGSRQERQAEFRARFGFTCSCECCRGERLFVNSDIIKATLPIGVEPLLAVLGKNTVEEVEAQVKVAEWFEEIAKLIYISQVSLYEFLKQLATVSSPRVTTKEGRAACVEEALDAMDSDLKGNNTFGFDDAFFDNYRARTRQSLLESTEMNFLTIIRDLAFDREDDITEDG